MRAQVSFTYPGVDRRALSDVTCHVRLDSRVAVLGRNGAGKTTLVKLLTAELKPQVHAHACPQTLTCTQALPTHASPAPAREPGAPDQARKTVRGACSRVRMQEGIVTRHPNLRVAYVAQHAFHHVNEVGHCLLLPAPLARWPATPTPALAPRVPARRCGCDGRGSKCVCWRRAHAEPGHLARALHLQVRTRPTAARPRRMRAWRVTERRPPVSVSDAVLAMRRWRESAGVGVRLAAALGAA